MSRRHEIPHDHLRRLGVRSLAEYREWCSRHGVSTSTRKTWQELAHERWLAAERTIESRLSAAKAETRRPLEIVRAIFARELDCGDLTLRHWIALAGAARYLDPRSFAAFRSLVESVERECRYVSSAPLISPWETEAPGELAYALARMARHHHRWVRSPETWRSRSRNARRRFGSLAAHLFAHYPVPAFLDSAWLRAAGGGSQHEDWYIALAKGASVRDLDLPIVLTRRMAHVFTLSPTDLAITPALRRAQVVGLGGSEALARAVLGTALGRSFANDEFWVTVLRFLVREAVDTDDVGPIVDWIAGRRFGAFGRPAAQPGFSMRGRTVDRVLASTRAWHRELARGVPTLDVSWAPSDIAPLETTAVALDVGAPRVWAVRELLSARDLWMEGRRLRHCVASYADSCAVGSCSIWGLGYFEAGVFARRVTIEVRRRTIVQARGKANRRPMEHEWSIIAQWARREGLRIPEYVR